MSTDAVRAALDAHDAEDAQAAADNTAAVERLNVQLQTAQDATLAAQQATALVQAAFDAYKLTHPDAPPPPPPMGQKTAFGFNVWGSWDGYNRPSGAETSAQLFARLKRQGFPAFDYAKAFYSGGNTAWNLPATWAKGNQGENDPTNPARTIVLSFLWTPGSIADKSHDAALVTYMQSGPAGWRIIFTRNEPDNNKLSAAQWPLYVADMNHLYDLIESTKTAATFEVRDCFMNYSLQPASGPAWKDSWTNRSKRHGIIFDAYNNQAHVDSTGATTVKQITDMLAHLGFTPDQCIIGEYGNRRPNDSNTPSGVKLADATVTDATRAAQMKVQYGALIAAGFEAVIAFDVVGSTGDHRYLDVDTASRAALASIMSA